MLKNINYFKKKKNNFISLQDKRSCSICRNQFNFEEYKEIYNYLGNFDDPVESFFKLLDSKSSFICSSSINIVKIWKNPKNKIFCPRCLLDFKHAYALRRKCIKCEREISFSECSWSGFNKRFLKEELMEYWINPILKFYCCDCFKNRMKKKS